MEKDIENFKREKPGEKIRITVNSKISFAVAGITSLIIYFGLSIYTDQLKDGIISVIMIGAQFLGVTFILDVIQQIIDVQTMYAKFKASVSEALETRLKPHEKALDEVVDSLKQNFDYLLCPESIPYEKIKDAELSVLFEMAAEQKVKNKEKELQLDKNSDIASLYSECMKNIRFQYLKRLETLEQGFINARFKRTIQLEPYENGFKVQVSIHTEMYIPHNISENQRTYRYEQDFNSQKEADSFQITECILNGNSKSYEARLEEKGGRYSRIHEEVMECQKRNLYDLKCSYMYDFPEFSQTYRISDDCPDFYFSCQIAAEENRYDVDVSVKEVKLQKNQEDALSKSDIEKGIQISTFRNLNEDNNEKTEKQRWVLSGSTIRIRVKRK